MIFIIFQHFPVAQPDILKKQKKWFLYVYCSACALVQRIQLFSIFYSETELSNIIYLQRYSFLNYIENYSEKYNIRVSFKHRYVPVYLMASSECGLFWYNWWEIVLLSSDSKIKYFLSATEFVFRCSLYYWHIKVVIL